MYYTYSFKRRKKNYMDNWASGAAVWDWWYNNGIHVSLSVSIEIDIKGDIWEQYTLLNRIYEKTSGSGSLIKQGPNHGILYIFWTRGIFDNCELVLIFVMIFDHVE